MKLFLISSLAMATLLAPLASSQAPFTIRSQQDGVITAVGDGGTVSLAATAVGTAKTATLTITYTGVGTTEISAIERTGSQDFSFSGSTPPFPLTRGATFPVTVSYLPTSSQEAAGLITFTWLNTDANAPATFTVKLAGTAPEFAYTYTPSGGNTTQVQPGAALAFPDTPLDTTTTGILKLTNVGTAPGAVNTVIPSGAGFAVTGLPLLPTEVAADGELSININFTPAQLNQIAGSLAIGLANGAVTFPLQGVGTGPSFTYEVTVSGETAPVMPGGAIKLPDTLLDDTNAAVMRVRNTGNGDGVVSAISLSGSGYSLSTLPILPATLAPGREISFAIEFAPSDVGLSIGRLLVGDAEFSVSASGVGALLAYHFVISGVTTQVDASGTVNFTPTTVGASSTATFLITNNGTTDTSMNSISLEKAESPFALMKLPALPLTIDSGETVSFTVEFAPDIIGSASDTLKLDNTSFTIAGRGNEPPPLPGFRFEGPSGNQGPRAQPTVGLTLDNPYPLKVTGTLTIAFASDAFSNDPSVQFASGSRREPFTIAANGTQAVFSNGLMRAALQTGTVAGAITITPSFATGKVDVTPEDPLTQTMTVAAAAPVILSAAATQRSVFDLDVQITGFSTSRKVTQITLSFSPVSGESVSTTSLSINVEGSFDAWYTSSQSTQFGSQFTATVPLSFIGNVNNAADPVATVQSISVTLVNAQGNSNSVTIPLQ